MEVKIIGLGNPKKYEGTRHNIGRDFVTNLVKEKKINFTQQKSKLSKATEITDNNTFDYYTSESYINNSGESFKSVFCNKPILIVVHDELDLPIGTFKFSFAKSDAGHNGIKSIIKQTKTKSFYRFRIGISPNNKIIDKADYVLNKFSESEKKILNEVFSEFKKTIDQINPETMSRLELKRNIAELFGFWRKN